MEFSVRETEEVLKRLRGHDLYYSEVSILECLWIAASLKRRGKFKSDVFELGLQSIFEGYRRAEMNSEISVNALRLYMMGHNDLIDCLLYSIALHYGMRFASLDEELKEFVTSKNLERIFFEDQQ